MFPKREEFQWRPASLLCKRFDLIDPYMGKVYIFFSFSSTVKLRVNRNLVFYNDSSNNMIQITSTLLVQLNAYGIAAL